MANERRGDIMPVELAMKRELAYQRKIAMLPGIDPLLVRASTPSLSPSPMLNISPSPNLTRLKWHAPTSSKKFLPHQQPRPIHSSHLLENPTDPFFCKICQVSCSGAISYKMHIRGQKHRAIVGNLKFGRKDGAVVRNLRKKCEFCNIWCEDDYSLEQHLEGKRHMSELQKLELAREGGVEIVKKRKWCKLCNIWCMDDASFKMHLKGQKHLTTLNAVPGNRAP